VIVHDEVLGYLENHPTPFVAISRNVLIRIVAVAWAV
jgi:hypothetical protein